MKFDCCDRNVQVDDKLLYVGDAKGSLSVALKSEKNKEWLAKFYQALRTGYGRGIESMKKLPLNKPHLIEMSFAAPW